MLTKKTCAGTKPNSQFCYSQHKHATLPWHTRLSSLLASALKTFFLLLEQREEGSKHGVLDIKSAHIAAISLIPKSVIWYQLCVSEKPDWAIVLIWLNVSLSNANRITPNRSLHWRVYLQMMCDILLLHNLSFIKLVIVLHVMAPVCCNNASGQLRCWHEQLTVLSTPLILFGRRPVIMTGAAQSLKGEI